MEQNSTEFWVGRQGVPRRMVEGQKKEGKPPTEPSLAFVSLRVYELMDSKVGQLIRGKGKEKVKKGLETGKGKSFWRGDSVCRGSVGGTDRGGKSFIRFGLGLEGGEKGGRGLKCMPMHGQKGPLIRRRAWGGISLLVQGVDKSPASMRACDRVLEGDLLPNGRCT